MCAAEHRPAHPLLLHVLHVALQLLVVNLPHTMFASTLQQTYNTADMLLSSATYMQRLAGHHSEPLTGCERRTTAMRVTAEKGFMIRLKHFQANLIVINCWQQFSSAGSPGSSPQAQALLGTQERRFRHYYCC